MADGGVPGVEDVTRLSSWLADNGIPAGDGPPVVKIIGGGRSNLTYRLDLGPGRAPLILRRPPLGHVLPTAHDMAREYRVLTGLNGTAVPVPRPVALGPDPAVAAAAPPGGLVHGDYRLDNMLIVLGDEPRIAAVVDWEMSTLGDPLADLGLALVYWTNPGEQDWLAMAASVTTAPGFATREQLTARYAQMTGRDLSRIGHYLAFGCFTLAVALAGL